MSPNNNPLGFNQFKRNPRQEPSEAQRRYKAWAGVIPDKDPRVDPQGDNDESVPPHLNEPPAEVDEEGDES